jgi:hypothetical protein
MTIKPPISSEKRASADRLLLLPQPEVHLCLVPRLILLRWLQVETVAIALILSINVHEHSEAFGDVTLRGQVDAEGLGRAGDCNESLDEAVAINGAIFFELEACFWPFDLAGNLSETGHLWNSVRYQLLLLYCSNNIGEEKQMKRLLSREFTDLRNEQNPDESVLWLAVNNQDLLVRTASSCPSIRLYRLFTGPSVFSISVPVYFNHRLSASARKCT